MGNVLWCSRINIGFFYMLICFFMLIFWVFWVLQFFFSMMWYNIIGSKLKLTLMFRGHWLRKIWKLSMLNLRCSFFRNTYLKYKRRYICFNVFQISFFLLLATFIFLLLELFVYSWVLLFKDSHCTSPYPLNHNCSNVQILDVELLKLHFIL